MFNDQKTRAANDIANDEEAKQTLNWYTGYILLIAVGSLLYITLMHILPEVYTQEHHDQCHEYDDAFKEEDEMGVIQGKDDNVPKKFDRGVQLATLIAGMFTAELLLLAPHPH